MRKLINEEESKLPCNQAAEGIGIVNRIKDYIEEQSE